jgi:hypothetical protein
VCVSLCALVKKKHFRCKYFFAKKLVVFAAAAVFGWEEAKSARRKDTCDLDPGTRARTSGSSSSTPWSTNGAARTALPGSATAFRGSGPDRRREGRRRRKKVSVSGRYVELAIYRIEKRRRKTARPILLREAGRARNLLSHCFGDSGRDTSVCFAFVQRGIWGRDR